MFPSSVNNGIPLSNNSVPQPSQSQSSSRFKRTHSHTLLPSSPLQIMSGEPANKKTHTFIEYQPREEKAVSSSAESKETTSEIDLITKDFLELEEKIQAFINRHSYFIKKAPIVTDPDDVQVSCKSSLEQAMQCMAQGRQMIPQLKQFITDLADKEWNHDIDECSEIIPKVKLAYEEKIVPDNLIATVIHKYIEFCLNKKNIAHACKTLPLCEFFIDRGCCLSEDYEHFKDLDLTFNGGKKMTVPIYMKQFLASYSPVFQTMFFGSFLEANKQDISFPHDSIELFLLMLNILKEEKNLFRKFKDFDYDSIYPIVNLAHKYDISEIIEYFVDELFIRLNNVEFTSKTFNDFIQIHKVIDDLQIKMPNGFEMLFASRFGSYLASITSLDTVMKAVSDLNEGNITTITLPKLSSNSLLHRYHYLRSENYPALRHLTLEDSTDKDLISLIGVTQLESLDLNGNNTFSDQSLACLQYLSLKVLKLGKCPSLKGTGFYGFKLGPNSTSISIEHIIPSEEGKFYITKLRNSHINNIKTKTNTTTTTTTTTTTSSQQTNNQ